MPEARVLVVDETAWSSCSRLRSGSPGFSRSIPRPTGPPRSIKPVNAGAGRDHPRRDDARHGRLRPAAETARRRSRRARVVPDRPRHAAGQDHRPHARRRRLRHQAVQPGRGRRPATGHPATRRPRCRAARTSGSRSPTSNSTRTPTRSISSKPASRSRCRRRSSPAADLRPRRGHRAEQTQDPRSRMALRLRRGRQRRRILRLLPAPQGRPPARNAVAAAHCAALATFSANRGNFSEKTIEGSPCCRSRHPSGLGLVAATLVLVACEVLTGLRNRGHLDSAAQPGRRQGPRHPAASRRIAQLSAPSTAPNAHAAHGAAPTPPGRPDRLLRPRHRSRGRAASGWRSTIGPPNRCCLPTMWAPCR